MHQRLITTVYMTVSIQVAWDALRRSHSNLQLEGKLNSNSLPIELVVAVTTRILLEVTLMIIFSGVESSCFLHSCHERIFKFFRALKVGHEFLGLLLLILRVVENNWSILSSCEARLVRYGEARSMDVVRTTRHGIIKVKIQFPRLKYVFISRTYLYRCLVCSGWSDCACGRTKSIDRCI